MPYYPIHQSRRGVPITGSDVQYRRIKNSFALTRVGVTGVKKPVVVKRGSEQITCNCTIDVFVDLPSEQKGSHLSRNLEVISELTVATLVRPISGLEELCAQMCKQLLDKHEYATHSEVHISADYFLTRKSPSGRESVESFTLMSMATANKNGPSSKMIGVKVTGMTACPCAMEVVREMYQGNVRMNDDFPTITHNQRNVVTVMLEVPDECDVEANQIVEVVESSFSSPTYEILKREDEARVVVTAHQNPKFVEDVVRDCLRNIMNGFLHLPDGVAVTIKSESEESIHKHNAFAERVTTMGELRATANGWV